MRYLDVSRGILLAAVGLVLHNVSIVEAGQTYFNVSSGYWTNAASWNPAVVPTSSDAARIGESTTQTCILDTAGQTANNLLIGNTASGMGTLNITGGDLTASGYQADLGNYGTGVVLQTSGTWNNGGNHIQMGTQSGSAGTYDISGGALTNFGNIYVGNNGQGTLNIAGTAKIIRNAVGGLIQVPVGTGEGAIHQSGGILNNGGQQVQMGYPSGSAGTYDISGGSLTNFSNIYVGHDGQGTLNIAGTAKIIRNAVAGWILVPGNTGEGAIYQSGGILNNGSQQIRMGEGATSTGFYEISGGTLTNTDLFNPIAGDSTFSVVGSSASIDLRYYQEQVAGGTLRVKPDSGGLSPINVSVQALLKGTLEVDFSEYDSTADLTVIAYGSISGTLTLNVLTEGWSAEIDHTTDNKVRLINIVDPPKGTVIAVN